MNRHLCYLLLAGLAVLVQTGLFPHLIPGDLKPDLLLILIIYLGLHENPWSGGGLVYLIGWTYDGFAGVFPGLHGFVLLSLFLAVRAVVTRVNTESSALLVLLVLSGTILQVILTAFALDFFRTDLDFWPGIFGLLLPQMLINGGTAYLLLRLAVWLQRTFIPRETLPGLRKLDSRYEP
ncbi:MAG: hypothetical protein C0614_09310 [Desulfuromonas sp.]|nr:MAG: hypothetical protein C0614_09310 [Desulfuromonas sp.]